ncbi:hypothetical protein [Pedobacter sandarakinus]|uniref:hypothetical protein n=1 Tax=Pedobacter sandarakinus TaxID=353156 RepID=UPI0022476BC6|nr:hypothetical protein [Pedobacter sandarakinus]MCX2575544.1 hypothetical protein [Pedobacter sandarakinus]
MKKITFLAFLFCTALVACKPGVEEKTYEARQYTSEDFNEPPKSKLSVLTIEDVISKDPEEEEESGMMIKYRDTTIAIADGKRPVAKIFKDARFINTQKTAALVQVEDGVGLVSPFYIISLKDGVVGITSLNKPSNGKNDKKYTKGIEDISISNIILNNDFAIALVNGKVYPIKRENERERIQGDFLFNSMDKRTLVFATANSLYQVDYKSGETQVLPLPESIAKSDFVGDEIRARYSWGVNEKGTSFLKKNPDENRIVDISEFKKK